MRGIQGTALLPPAVIIGVRGHLVPEWNAAAESTCYIGDGVVVQVFYGIALDGSVERFGPIRGLCPRRRAEVGQKPYGVAQG